MFFNKHSNSKTKCGKKPKAATYKYTQIVSKINTIHQKLYPRKKLCACFFSKILYYCRVTKNRNIHKNSYNRGEITMKKTIIAAVIIAAAIAGAFAILRKPDTPAQQTVFRFAGQSAPNSPATKFMQDISKEIAEKTNNRVILKVYPANQLGNYSVVTPELMKGTIDFSCQSIATDFDKRLEILYTNGYISSYEDAKKTFAADGWMTKQLDKCLNEAGIKMLGCYIEGFIGIASKKPLNDPLNPKVDKGVLTRIPNMLSFELGAKAMGFRPVTIPYSDVYQSMQTGVCDAADGYPTYAAYTILGDVMKYWYNTMYSVEYLGILASEKAWQKISPEDQKIIAEICAKHTAKGLEEAEANDKQAMELMKKRGIQVFTYSKEELKALHDANVASWGELAKRGVDQKLMTEFIEHFK